jgi:hypothetical protein
MGFVLALACSTRSPTPPTPAPAPRGPIVDPPRHPGRPLLLLAMPDFESFRSVRSALVGELGSEFDFATLSITARTEQPDFAAKVEALRPACLVVMDNVALGIYREYAESRPPDRPAPPAVVTMTPFFIEELRRIKNTTGVAYEVPGVTAFVKLRSLISKPLQKVAVIHRPRFRDFIERQGRLAAREDIELLPIEVRTNPTTAEIQAAIADARTSDAGALWVLADRKLLKNAQFITEVWRPEIEQFRVPVIVGLKTLVMPAVKFGNFGVVPDHGELGVQTARLIQRVAESGWQADEHPVELPLSTVTIANLASLREQVGLQTGAASRVDEVVE